MSYYIVKVYGLTCDATGCIASQEHVPRIDSPTKLADTRRTLAAQSWTFRHGRDFCPGHSAGRMITTGETLPRLANAS